MRFLLLNDLLVALACFLLFFFLEPLRVALSSASTASWNSSLSFLTLLGAWSSSAMDRFLLMAVLLFFASSFCCSGSILPWRTADLAALWDRTFLGPLVFLPSSLNIPAASLSLCSCFLSSSSSSLNIALLLFWRDMPAYLSFLEPVMTFFLEMTGRPSSSSSASSCPLGLEGSSLRPLAGLSSRVARFSCWLWNHDFLGLFMISS
mmetsp:Transcript_26821/g.66084  ORF Transcript_26821/g.66084 Transcript_26821/m.66084 type:complete len:206 (+) Transcript_26821:72-689(+)